MINNKILSADCAGIDFFQVVMKHFINCQGYSLPASFLTCMIEGDENTKDVRSVKIFQQ